MEAHQQLSHIEQAPASEVRRDLFARPRAVLGLAGIYAVSRALGLGREMGVAFFFGTSAAADRFSAAFVVAGLASIVVGEALYAGSVRWLGNHAVGNSAVAEAQYAELVAVGRKAALTATVIFLLLGPAATVLVLGDTDDAASTIALAVALAPSIGANLFVACVNARLTLERRFALLNAVPMLYSAGALAGLGVIAATGANPDPLFVAVGWSVGNVAAALALYSRARPKPSASRRLSASAIALLRIGLPLAVAFSLVAIQGLTDRAVAARLGTGNVAALSYADRLFLLPIGFVIAALGPMVLGTLVAERQERHRTAVVAFEQLRTLVAAVIPLSLGFAAFAPWLVTVLFESGDFDAQSRELTVAALDGFAVGISAVALSLVLFRVLQAVSQLRDTVLVALTAVSLNAVTSVAGGAWIGLYGVTLSTSLVAVALVVVQVRRVTRELGGQWAANATRYAVVPVTVCSAASLIVVTAEHRGLLDDLGRALVLTALAVVSTAYAKRTYRPAP